MATTIRRELGEEVLSAVRADRGTALDAPGPLVETVHCVIPAMPVVRVPLAGLLPTAREAVAGGYGLAGHLPANRRQFAAR